MVGGVVHGEGTGALAVVDVGGAGTDGVSFQGHGEAPQPTVFLPGWGVSVGPDGPQAPLHRVGTADGLKGFQQQEGPVLALSWRQETEEPAGQRRKRTPTVVLGQQDRKGLQ